MNPNKCTLYLPSDQFETVYGAKSSMFFFVFLDEHDPGEWSSVGSLVCFVPPLRVLFFFCGLDSLFVLSVQVGVTVEVFSCCCFAQLQAQSSCESHAFSPCEWMMMAMLTVMVVLQLLGSLLLNTVSSWIE